MHPKKGVIMDFDGVLLDSFRGGLRKIQALCAMEGIVFGREARQRLTAAWGLPGIELLEKGLCVSRAMAIHLNEKWIRWDNAEPPDLIPGTRETLFWLRRADIPVCLLTSRHRKNVALTLDRQDLVREFAHVCCREDVTHHKPDPRSLRPPLEKLRELYGIRKEECVFVGDTPSDIEAGHRARITTLVVQTGPYLLEHSHKVFGRKKIKLSNILRSIEDLPSWLDKHFEAEWPEIP